MADTTGGAGPVNPSNSPATPAASGSWLASNGKWVAGYAALWLILEGMNEAGMGELAAAIALVSVGSSFFVWWKPALSNLNKMAGGAAIP